MKKTWKAAKILFVTVAALCAACSRTHDVVKVVSQDGTGDYTTVQAAFDDVPEHFEGGKWIIKVRPGRYYEQLSLAEGKDHVVLLGEDAGTTVLWYDDYAGSETQGVKQSTAIYADDFTAVNITFLNPHQNIREQPGENKHSQATALMTCGDRAAFYHCRMIGNQDTFWGRSEGRVYVKDCYVEGNVDYIYGSSVMVFDGCEIFSNQHDSYITAASTPAESKFGITFLDCRLTAKEPGQPDHDGVPFENFYLGRPWHKRPHVAFIRCEEPGSVYPAAWTFMNDDAIPTFYEYACTGPGAAPERLAAREMGGRQLTDEEAAAYTVENIFSARTNPAFSGDWRPAADWRGIR